MGRQRPLARNLISDHDETLTAPIPGAEVVLEIGNRKPNPETGCESGAETGNRAVSARRRVCPYRSSTSSTAYSVVNVVDPSLLEGLSRSRHLASGTISTNRQFGAWHDYDYWR